jgi:hypothetical protein
MADLPTDPALLDPAVATPAQHRAWHEAMHAFWPESPAAPTSIPAGSTGNLAHHDALEALVGAGLPTSYAENDPDHWLHHRILHAVHNVGGTNAVVLTEASNIQAALDAQPAGTTFLLTKTTDGIYRIPGQEGLNPKNNQKLVGVGPGVILNGSKVLPASGGWTQSGSAWWAAAFLPGAANGHGFCELDGENGLCTHRQDVFYDGVRLTRVGSQGAVVAGTFWTDYTNNRVYIGNDPSGHLVEQAWNNRLVASANTGIRVRNLVLEKAANDSQSAAVEPTGAGGWTIEWCDVRYNHGGGIGLGPGPESPTTSADMIVRRCRIHHNGQIGFSGQGDDHLVEHNEVHHNNDVGFSSGWEAGAMKAVFTNRLIVRGNYSHDNKGPGLWTDINNYQTLYEGNYVADNVGYGLLHEISYDATIQNNTMVRNAGDSGTGFYTGGQIVAAASRNVTIQNNFAYGLTGSGGDGADGIGGLQQGRGDNPALPNYHGAWEIRNLTVTGNEIVVAGAGSHLIAGISSNQTEFPTIYTGWGISFEGNTYHDALGCSSGHWGWNDQGLSFASWQGFGHDTPVGSCDGTVPPIPSPPTLVVGPQP